MKKKFASIVIVITISNYPYSNYNYPYSKW